MSEELSHTEDMTIEDFLSGATAYEIAVSYTHLENHYQVLAGTSRWWTKDEHIPANQGSASDPIMDIKNRVKETVSYTHLDVYKRQLLE